ncbi:ATP-binding protein [Nocardiopsis alba]|uniref:Carbamoyl-phosphate synthase L chain, ATP binding domain protein n=1 Tax=Nocardiopsis alba (strain ATCC BAA-2165 / BE74) TaxID=1205910 RepID=J7LGG2_NOCAA|nr:biotin carboxylase N-terminal domain-containing protein [Nocardiopsis alba]AFR09999.1 carbamoyl-phosphate synthase L chain, ATP binding domain protein [Nocardiopsis alba ATCC BAA-2165]
MSPDDHVTPVTALLVANRGEIARRVLRTCRALGVSSVAVHTPGEEDAPHVREADAAAALPVPEGRGPVDAYLDPDALVDAARRAGADAVHPGYGFLSENAGFARAVVDAGLIWVGPAAEVIERMGSKTLAKRVARDAGVPVADALDPADVRDEHLPVLVKAVSGGGGRGMRVVRDLEELPGEVDAARSEAASAFGDPEVFCEPYVERGRHVEVQILADAHGTVWAVGERDCSVQRRHQKVLEEAPAPGLPDALRARLHRAARDLAAAIGYTGAGTAEFLVPVTEDGPGEPVFLEMNTRLQVEHPVTECVTGLDLVEWQIRIAEGEPLPAPEPPEPRGHAIEARLYAEDPRRDWRPRTGTLHAFEVPAATAFFETPAGYGVRLDHGVEAGDEVGTDFDPLLAKVVAHGRDRRDALRRLSAALSTALLHGVGTNRDLLVRILGDPHLVDPARLHTGLLTGERLVALARPLADEGTERAAALAASLAAIEAVRGHGPTPVGAPAGWRNVPSAPHERRHRTDDGREIVSSFHSTRGVHRPVAEGVRVLSVAPDLVVLETDGVRRPFEIHRAPATPGAPGSVHVRSSLGTVVLTPVDPLPVPETRVDPGALPAPMPGTITAVDVEVGQSVREGQTLLRMEAMKMEHRVTAPADGTVRELPVKAGERVPAGTPLAVLDHTGTEEPPGPPESTTPSHPVDEGSNP